MMSGIHEIVIHQSLFCICGLNFFLQQIIDFFLKEFLTISFAETHHCTEMIKEERKLNVFWERF